MLWWTLRGLRSPRPEIRREAIHSAGTSGKRGAVPALIKALSDEDSSVRAAAMEALAHLGDRRAVEPLAAFLVNPAAKERASRSESREGQDCEHAAIALAQLGEPALKPLMAALQSGSKEARRASAQALGKLRDARALGPLSLALNDTRSEVRQAAALALGDLGNRSALKDLTQAVRHKDRETRRAVAEAAGKLGGEDAVPLLARAVEDQEEGVQIAAIDALKSIGGTKAALVLKPALHSTRKGVRDAAAAALRRMSFAGATADERAALAVLTGDFPAAVREGEAAEVPLVEALGAPDVARRRQAASALEALRSAAAIPSLIRALRDHDAEVREIAARTLAATGPEAVLPLMEAVGSHDATAQRLAARALGQIGDIRAIGPLVDCIAANRSARTYLEPLEAARAARDALSSILKRSAENIPPGELQHILSVPDAVRENQSGEDGQSFSQEVAVDCSELRSLSRLELDKRR